MRQYRLDAYNEAGIRQFTRLVPNLEAGIKECINNPFALKVSWVSYRNHRYTWNDLMGMLAKRSERRNKQAEYSERWD